MIQRLGLCAVCALIATGWPLWASAQATPDPGSAGAAAPDTPAEQIAEPADERTGGAQAGEADADTGEARELLEDARQGIADASITARIETMFLLNDDLNPFRINTTTRNGVVSLVGTVDSEIDRKLAEDLARTVSGVREVQNQLEVQQGDVPSAERPQWSRQVDDISLNANIRRRLAYHSGLSTAAVDLDVDSGIVRVSGAVDSERQKEAVLDTIRNTRGVRTVEDNLVVEPDTGRTEVAREGGDGAVTRSDDSPARPDAERQETVAGADTEVETETAVATKDRLDDIEQTLSDEWIEKRVETSLFLNRQVSLWDLDVEVKDGVAYLSGTTISEPQKELAGRIARDTSGVQSVQNNITVEPYEQTLDDQRQDETLEETDREPQAQ